MGIAQPSRLVLGGLLGLYGLGFGLLVLGLLRGPRWLGEGAAAGRRALALLLGWIALHTLAVWGYFQRPELRSPVQSLEVGWIWGRAGEPWAHEQAGYALLAKRPLPEPLTLRAARDALVRPMAPEVAFQLQGDHLGVRLIPEALPVGEPVGLGVESIRPLPLRASVSASVGGVEGPSIRVYNGTSWRLRDVTLWRDRAFYALGDLGPGETLEVELRGHKARPRRPEGEALSFEEYAKRELLALAERALQREAPAWALLGWVVEAEAGAETKTGDGAAALARSPLEHRLVLKLVLLEAPSEEQERIADGDGSANARAREREGP